MTVLGGRNLNRFLEMYMSLRCECVIQRYAIGQDLIPVLGANVWRNQSHSEVLGTPHSDRHAGSYTMENRSETTVNFGEIIGIPADALDFSATNR